MGPINQFYELLDNACLILNEKLNINYLDCLIRVGKDITYELNDSKLDEEEVLKLEKIYAKVNNLIITNEEIRQALELLIVKAFKHINYSMDLMTPDYICYLFSFFICKLMESNDYLTILDVCLGTSNLLNSISNNYPGQANLLGIENNNQLVELSRVVSDLQNNEVKIYHQDCMQEIPEKCQIIVGDLPSEIIDNKYLPYEIISKYVFQLDEEGFFIYLIQNDFFMKEQLNDFRQKFRGTLLGLIVLPEELFQDNHIGKSIIIGTSKLIDDIDMMVIQMPSLKNQDIFQNKLLKIEEWIKGLVNNI